MLETEVKTSELTQTLSELAQPESVQALGKRARKVAFHLGLSSAQRRKDALQKAAQSLRQNTAQILEANQVDLAFGRERNLTRAMLDRLTLTEDRLEAVSASLEAVAEYPDPLGRVIKRQERPNGLVIECRSVPLGVVGCIYESRPNVTVDAAGLCIKSGNSVILRCGSECFETSSVLVGCMRSGLVEAGLDADCVQMIPTRDRAAVGIMLGLEDDIDIIVPRGGRGLIERVSKESRIPVIKHLDGLCHTYIHSSARPDMALDIVLNAKMRRTGICSATETLLIDEGFAEMHLPLIGQELQKLGCEIRGDARACALIPGAVAAQTVDWDTEYLDAILAVRCVPSIESALAHIAQHSSQHSEAIIAEDRAAADLFLAQVDSAVVLHNASTQYSDGGEFGYGAEIGISTGKIHARGPVGADKLTSYKYCVFGNGQCRP